MGIVMALLSALLLAQPAYALSASFPKSDSVITAQLEATIAKDKFLSHLPFFTISTQQQIVSIGGWVPTTNEAKKLIMLAESIAGVQAVDVFDLVIKNGTTLTNDDIIVSLVAGLFIREGLMVPTIQVAVRRGTVYLSGTMDNATSIDHAVSFAQSIPGVTEVLSTITVKTPQ